MGPGAAGDGQIDLWLAVVAAGGSNPHMIVTHSITYKRIPYTSQFIPAAMERRQAPFFNNPKK